MHDQQDIALFRISRIIHIFNLTAHLTELKRMYMSYLTPARYNIKKASE